MAQGEPVYTRDCEKCGEPRLLYGQLLQMKEGEGECPNVKQLSIRCGCGTSPVNDRDLAALRHLSLETAVAANAKNPQFVDGLRGAALIQCYALYRAGHASPSRSVMARVRALNDAAGRQDELMEHYVAEACLRADKAWQQQRHPTS
jgi:hypothetical protein